jgi:hypothetical protein
MRLIMKRTGRFCLAMLLVIAACKEGSSPSGPSRTTLKQRLSAHADLVDQAGSNFYQVFVSSGAAPGIGQYTVMTGPNHPVTLSTGAMKNVLFGDGAPSTSYESIRSYTSGTTYVTSSLGLSSDASIFLLDPTKPGVTATVVPLGTTGFRTTFTLAGPPQTPDKLTIVEVVDSHGSTFETATVEVTTTVTNNGTSPVAIGVRYLWDTQIGEDDGPTFQQLSPDQPAIVTEKSFTSPTFGFYRIQDNDGNETTPLFSVYGTVNGPSSVTPAPTVPDLLVNADWTQSVVAPFAYTSTGQDVSTESGSNDNAVLYYWGPTQATAINLAAGASRSVSQSLVSGEANAPPPFNQSPTATITAPAVNASFAQGASVSFAGTGTDPEDGTLSGSSLVWTDNLNGQIGTGTSFSLTTLSVGSHTVTLTVTDSQGAKGTATRTFTITAPTQNQSPTATITSPTTGSIFTPGSPITITGTGSDPEDGNLSGASLVFTDNVSGQIGTGTSVTLASTAVGIHTITLTATDSKGAKGTATITISIGYSQVIGADGGSLCVEACHLSLYIPAGALASSTTFIEWPVANPPSPNAGMVGSAHVISPSPLNFMATAELGIGYDPATLPAGVTESSLRLYEYVGGAWQPLAGSNVNTTSHIVYAPVVRTGVFAIVGGP